MQDAQSAARNRGRIGGEQQTTMIAFSRKTAGVDHYEVYYSIRDKISAK
jgi:hypothetical protein